MSVRRRAREARSRALLVEAFIQYRSYARLQMSTRFSRRDARTRTRVSSASSASISTMSRFEALVARIIVDVPSSRTVLGTVRAAHPPRARARERVDGDAARARERGENLAHER